MKENFILPENYKDYINNIIEISKTSTKENSLLYNFEIDNNTIHNTVTLIEIDGTKKLLKSGNFNLSNNFYNYFLNPLMNEFTKSNNVVFDDIVDIDRDNKVTYRLITDNNDLFTVNGLSFEDTSYISNVLGDVRSKKHELEQSKVLIKNRSGKINVFLLMCLISFIGFLISLVIISVIYFI